MTQATSINTGAYWDGRFATDWESFEGPRQSRFFARLAVEHLPRWLLEQVKRDALSVADWGCAQGDGTDVLAGYVDARQITGVDFSAVAVEQARQRYPALRFTSEDWLGQPAAAPEAFDVVFSSNTLEHFHRPYETLAVLAGRARKAVVLALPFRETERIDEHFFSFLPENVPLVLANGFRLVWSQVVDCRALENAMWGGEQIFLVYADAAWLDGLQLTLGESLVAMDDQASPLRRLDALLAERDVHIAGLNQALAERGGQLAHFTDALHERGSQAGQLSHALAERDGQIACLNRLMGERGGQCERLTQALAERDGRVAELGLALAARDAQLAGLERMVPEHAGQIGALSAALAERDARIAELDGALAKREARIAELDGALAEREAGIAELDGALTERESHIGALGQALDACHQQLDQADAMRHTRSWRLTSPLRFGARLIRHGFLADDKRKLIQGLRSVYHRVPLPAPAKQALGATYRNTLGASYVAVRKQVLAAVPFEAPAEKPAAQLPDAPDYIVWGVIDWHFRHQRPQQLAQALAASGRRVFYVSANLVDDARPGFRHEALDTQQRLFQVNLFAQGAPVIYTSAPNADTVRQLRGSIGDVMAWAESRQMVSLVQHPFWHDIACVLPNSRVIYDCMDHHEGFGNTADAVLSLERALMRNADLTVTTSAWLDQIVAEHAPHRALIRNAGEFGHFSRRPAATYVEPQGRPVIGYYGAIAEWFDLDLVEALAQRFGDCRILLIGDDTVNAKGRFAHLPNVSMTGEVAYAELPKYLHAFDVCLLPFKVIPLTLATNPVKVYEYLSAGKPVVSVDLPEMQQFGELVRVAGDTEAFLAAVAQVVRQPDSAAAQARRQDFAREQTWNHRAAALIASAESAARDPKISVIVVTYNNLDYTKACLASLDQHTQYENLEIIVVDNASADGSPVFLGEWVKGAANRRLILNDDNRGFAAANNQGLAVADGDYLVLLNNDTYVTPGWVRTLYKHLQRDPGIGLIGPVTNNIGNAAKIDIHYADMEAMLAASGRYTRSHIGEVFTLHTAAFFCVMMAREVYRRIGDLDEAFGRGFFEDDDYCRRIEQLGLRVVCAEDVFIHHHLSASFNKLRSADRQALFEANKVTYEKKWGTWVPHSYERPQPR
jgi:GT2 family glycosyltransferase/glycosyltransferase involved in cell wall biosynthesis/uncharacterized coiled-coil protein SlyX